jgi:glycosyltransferase involved in cell wall biosynthesis
MNKAICFIRQSIYPYELSFRREVETIQRAGLETHVICLTSKHHENEEVIDGVYVHRLPLRRKKTSMSRYMYDYISFTFLAALKVARLHFKHRFSAIQVNTMPDFLVFASLIPKLLGVKVVAMMQEPVPELWATLRDTSPPKALTWAEQSALAYADAALTVTQQLKDVYVSRGAKADKIGVILNVPETRFLELNGNQPHRNEHFTLICHGAIEFRYGQDTMLEAMALLKSELPDIRLHILGAGSYVEEFEAMIKKLKLEDRVNFLGWVSHEEMLRQLRAADVGIVAQKSSPYSNLVHTNKMYEYIALGKPVLASRLTSVHAYFGDDALCYFEPGNAESLAQGIVELYRNPARRESLVKNARHLYEQYQWERQQDIYLSVYEGLLNVKLTGARAMLQSSALPKVSKDEE